MRFVKALSGVCFHYSSKSICTAASVAVLILAAVSITFSSASASILKPGALLDLQAAERNPVIDVVVVRRGRAAVGPRGGVAYRSRTVVRPGWRGAGTRRVVRPVPPVRRPWVRPSRYWWPAGGAIAAGAAVGFMSAAAAASRAGSPPAPGYCWYYTDGRRTKGFWDKCP